VPEVDGDRQGSGSRPRPLIVDHQHAWVSRRDGPGQAVPPRPEPPEAERRRGADAVRRRRRHIRIRLRRRRTGGEGGRRDSNGDRKDQKDQEEQKTPDCQQRLRAAGDHDPQPPLLLLRALPEHDKRLSECQVNHLRQPFRSC
jgi:hypothetical protein